MAYSIVLTNGSVLTNVADNTVDNTTSLTLVGRNYPGYGTFIADNFVRLLENGSAPTPPSTPLTGQLWWDSNNSIMKVWTGPSTSPNAPPNQWYALTTGVSSVLGNSGAVTLPQMVAGGLAPLASPALTGVPTAPTPPLNTSSNQVATASFVMNQLGTFVGGVSSVVGATGAVTLSNLISGGVAPLGSPQLTGVPTAPTAATGTNNNQIATTAFVTSQVGALSTGVSSVVGATGAVTLAQLSTGGVAPKASPAFSGVPTSPTPAVGTNTNQVATCAFVSAAIAAAAPSVRIRLTGDLTFYVSPTGNDTTGDGTQAKPFATMQNAYQVAWTNYDGNGHNLYLILLPGTHTSGLGLFVRPVGFYGINVQSVYTNGHYSASTTIVNATGPNMFGAGGGNCFLVSDGVRLNLRGLTLGAPGGSNTISQQTGNCLWVGNNGIAVIAEEMVFGASGGSHMLVQNGIVAVLASYTITGSAPAHIIAAENGQVNINGAGTPGMTCTLVGTINFSTAFAWLGQWSYTAIINVTFVGSATGPKYTLTTGSLLSVNGAGVNYLPGTPNSGTLSNAYYI
jgi:hypothetical protein